MRRLALALCFAIGMATSAVATTGNDLYGYCSSSGRVTYESGSCIGYIGGVADAITADLACFPTGVDRGQARDVVVKYLAAHPEKRHASAAALVALALAAAFPCPAKQ